ncbi:hypothetical protein ACHQM5_008807 [Ranunculus cassubicifolius]
MWKILLLKHLWKFFLCFLSMDKGVEVDCHTVEFDDIRYHIQVSTRYPQFMQLSMSLPTPTPPPETVFYDGLPFGAIEAVKATYGLIAQILDPPKDGYNLTMKLNLENLPEDEDEEHDLLLRVASLREVVLGAPLRMVLMHLGSRTPATDVDELIALVHRPRESFFVLPEAEKVTVVFPMRFSDSTDTVLATSFLQEFVEARRTPGLTNAPPCFWSASPPPELEGAPSHALTANAGFVTFGVTDATSDHLFLLCYRLMLYHGLAYTFTRFRKNEQIESSNLRFCSNSSNS